MENEIYEDENVENLTITDDEARLLLNILNLNKEDNETNLSSDDHKILVKKL